MVPTQYTQYPQGQPPQGLPPQGQATQVMVVQFDCYSFRDWAYNLGPQVFHGPLIHPYMTGQSIANYGMYQTPLVQQMPPHTPAPQVHMNVKTINQRLFYKSWWYSLYGWWYSLFHSKIAKSWWYSLYGWIRECYTELYWSKYSESSMA